MKLFSSRHSRLHCPAVWRVGAMLVPLFWSASSAVAQPQTDPPARMGPQGQSAFYQWSELQRAMAQVELREPAQAVAAYQKFYETSGHQDVQVAVAVTSRIAQLWGRDLKNPGQAVEIYAWALKQWEQTPYGERLRREAEQMKALASHAPNAVIPDAVTPDAAAQTPASVAKVPSPVSVPSAPKLPLPMSVPSIAKLPSALGVPSAPNLPSAAGVAFVVGGSALAVTVEAIQSGRQSAEAAWKHGDLSVEQVLGLLDQLSTRSRGAVEGRIGSETRRALARLVVAHAPQLVERPQALGLASRLWVGEVLGADRDERAVAVLKSVLGELKGRTPLTHEDEMVWAFLASERLAWFYRDTAQPQQAAQSWLGVGPLLAGAPLGEQRAWFVPDSLVEAARAYGEAGDEEKSKRLYAQVLQEGNGWLSALSLYDQALPLMGAGKWDEAKALLSRPLVMTQATTDGRIAQNAWLASLSYQQGDLESALRYGKQVQEAGQGQNLTRESVKSLYHMGLDIYSRAGGWRTQPIQTEVKEVVFQANPSQPDKPLYARFRIKTYGDTSVTVSVDNPQIQARVLPVNNWQREGLNAREEEMEVIVQSNSLQPFTNVPLVLSSKTRGKTTIVRVSLAEKSA